MFRAGLLLFLSLMHVWCLSARALTPQEADTDRDGLNDALEARLLQQFRPVWMISEKDCSGVPARFAPGEAVPHVTAEDGTVYAQARPVRAGVVEVHYYHLWRRDCGEMGHALDAEHVAVLVEAAGAEWRATTWYAAAHEDTVCDAGQVTRASTIDAVEHGARVWISAGKHASYLAERLCSHGCGGDRCEHLKELPAGELINLGEPEHPLVAWTGASQWPLLEKMSRSDFPSVRMARLEKLPETDIAWATPEKRPAQAAILGANAGLGGTALGASTGARATNTAMVVATDKTGGALGSAVRHTGGALGKSYRGVRRGLGRLFGEKTEPQ